MEKEKKGLQIKPWMVLVGIFAVLIVIGIATS